MLAAFKQFFAPSTLKEDAFEAYVDIVAQARNPVFYKEWNVEDTVDGRFDIIVLHLCLVLMRCEQELSRPEVHAFSRHLSEAFFADMDRSLREMGASDTGVGVRVKKMAQAFYGRQKAYREIIGDETALADVLARNVYRERPVPRESIASLAAYAGRNHKALKQQHMDALMQGRLSFSN
jgi:cytochrome b pre-mRNA-processing protein 3